LKAIVASQNYRRFGGFLVKDAWDGDKSILKGLQNYAAARFAGGEVKLKT